ncbi:MAG: hypothetical protein ACOC55_05430 [Candidatus Natronoplasma sp.]
MRTIFKILGLIIIAVVIIAASIYIVMWDMKKSSYSSEYEYQVEIHPDRDIYNVTVMVPLPEELSEENITAPEDWDVIFNRSISLGGIEYQNVLVITADRIEGGSYRSVYVSMGSEDDIDTKDPWEKEPMLEPKADTTEVECDYPGTSDDVECYEYTGEIFARFEAGEDARTNISVEIYGSNSWWVGGWSGNEYYDRFWREIEGSGEGHYETEGDVRTGMGNY